MRDLRQGVGLVHELGQLGGAEELLDHGRHGLAVDEIIRLEGLDLAQAHPLLDGLGITSK